MFRLFVVGVLGEAFAEGLQCFVVPVQAEVDVAHVAVHEVVEGWEGFVGGEAG